MGAYWLISCPERKLIAVRYVQVDPETAIRTSSQTHDEKTRSLTKQCSPTHRTPDGKIKGFGWEALPHTPSSQRMRSVGRSFFLIRIVGGGVQLSPLGTAATNWPIVPARCDYDDGEIGGMIGRENRSTRRKPAPVLLCPPQISHAARMRTLAAGLRGRL
jgi:hypothetical protein